MDGRCSTESRNSEPEEVGIAPENNAPRPPGEPKPAQPLSPSHKRSRRSVQKRVVSVPISGDGDGSPPADSWAWRKYGQKPIKGSPYPRGYYRCSSCKGCPARKQVERSRVDPTMLLITYTGEHDHPWPLPRNTHQRVMLRSVETPIPTPDQEPAATISGPTGLTDQDENFADLIADESSSLISPEDLYWLSALGSTSSISPPEADVALLYGPVCGAGADVPAAGVAMMFADECERLSGEGCGGGGREEDSLFVDLGELPECSAVFRRGFVERNLRGQENRRCTLTAAGCCGNTG